LCNTCEKRGASGWSHGAEVETAPKPSIEDETTSQAPYSFRRRPGGRRLDSEETSSRNQSLTPDVNLRPHVSKRTPTSASRYKNAESPLANSPSLEPRSLNFEKRKRGSPLKIEKFVESTIDQEPGQPLDVSSAVAMTMKTQAEPENQSTHISSQSFANVISSQPSPVSSMDHSRRGSISTAAGDGQTTSTDATSVDDDTIIVKQPMYLNPTIPAAKKIRGGKVVSVLEQAKTTEAITIGPSTSLQHPAIELIGSAPESVLSELEKSEMNVLEQSLEASIMVPPKKTRGRKKKRKLEESGVEDSETTSGDKRRRCSKSPTPETAPIFRVPGDYSLTPALLAQPASAWINCSICEGPFVQENAYFTRSSCPRCERHSKLYGYMWPKTDKESRDDSEERVLDHRTVHRFIRPDEERSIRQKNHNITGTRAISQAITRVVSTREVSEPVQNHEEEVTAPKVKRGRGRPRKTM
jgi:histone-lysine N-methyltransferase SUV420H